MQHLHLVGFTAELDGLIFSAKRGSRSGGYVIALDDRLLDAIREAVRLQTGGDPDLEDEEREADDSEVILVETVPELRRLGRVHSVLSPKEIQARLRAGRSTAEVADEAEVDESWILRFASPVLAEQSRVVERALQVPCRANRKGESAEPLSESVAENLIERGTLLTDDERSSGWSAYHVRDTSWVVRFRYVSRRRQQVAQWAFDIAESTLVPLNRLATDLGYLDPARRKRRPGLSEVVDDRRPPEGDDPMAQAAVTGRTARPTARRSTSGTSGRARSTAGSRPPVRPVKKVGSAKATGAAKAPTGKAATPVGKPVRRRAPATARKAAAAPARNAKGKATGRQAAARSRPATAVKATPRQGTVRKVAAGTRKAATKAAPRQATVRKVAAGTRKAAAKAAPRQATARKATARQATARQASGGVGKTAPARKASARSVKSATTKAPARKAPARAAATREVPARKAPARKAATRKVPDRKAAARKVAASRARKPAEPQAFEPDALSTPAEVNGTVSTASTASLPTLVSAPIEQGAEPVEQGAVPIKQGAQPVRTRRPAVAAIRREPVVPVARRTRPLVAVRSAPNPPPLAERVVRMPGGGAPPASSDSGPAVVILADPAGPPEGGKPNSEVDRGGIAGGADGRSPTVIGPADG